MTKMSEEQRRYVEQFATAWKRLGQLPMSGRVLALLLTTPEEYLSSAEIADQLGVSQPSVSNSTRPLLDSGMIYRYHVPGDRSHYFAAHPDPWANAALRAQPASQVAMQVAVQPTPELESSLSSEALARVRNAIDYQLWIWDRRHELLAEWEAHKRARDAADESNEHV